MSKNQKKTEVVAEAVTQPAPEYVLAFPADEITGFVGHYADTKAKSLVTSILDSNRLVYLNRDEAEQDESHKQIIPYVVIRRGNEVFRYERTKKGGENRLHNKHSVGVGGHVNPVDEGDASYATYEAALRREVLEEIGYELPSAFSAQASIIGCIYDDSSDVNRVHFGIVHEIRVPFGTPLKLENALANGRFEGVSELKRSKDNFEDWSKLVIKHML